VAELTVLPRPVIEPVRIGACAIHWRFSVERGEELGYQVGDAIFDTLLLPTDGE
jgi:hypothetical protein